ncbi:hypothetical protein CDL12_29712 [Handroanthus impetiginosus]|uniref:Uncharacterized protein n=1 Tax=Handroanthus impetiginosus TaxID=429701 RepID=A0A2G9FXN9_9LAMI|nr:hypothetical protein CDL12_29712 [Handroanthus impetiginosus]
MAANLQSRGVASLGKRLVSQIRSCDSATIPSVLSLRSVHGSVYDKNPEENFQPTVVPDEVIPPQPEEYWAPHPKTGVFGPAKDGSGSAGDSSVDTTAGADSVLEQKTFIRPQEDLDKPPVQP